MPDLTTELNLALATDNDDQADYLDLDTGASLRTSLRTIDGLFNTATGHTHNGAHQGGSIGSIPASAIPDGSITSAKIADSGIATVDLADGAVTTPKIATGVTLTTPTITGPTITGPTITGTVAGGPVFSSGPFTTDWFRVNTLNQGLFCTPVNIGIAFDATGPYVYNGYGGGHLITESAAQTLTNKTLNSPALNSPALSNPTLSGTVSGAPTWAAAQTLPVASKIGSGLAVANNNPSSPEWRLDTGSTGILSAAVGGNVFNIGFGAGFTAQPVVVANVQGVSGGQNTAHVTWWTSNVTTSGFQLFVNNGSGGGQSLECSWLAMGH